MALAYATDLATGHSRDFALRSCVLGMRMADVAQFDVEMRRGVWHQALLRYIGCNADSHLLATAWGDEIALRKELARTDMGNKAELGEAIARAIRRKFPDLAAGKLAEAIARGLADAPQINIPILSGHCEVSQRIAERIGLPDAVRQNLGQLYERWDGKGMPYGLSGDAVRRPVRVVTLAQDAIALQEAHGFEAMKAMIGKRAGGGYEPALGELFLAHADATGALDVAERIRERTEQMELAYPHPTPSPLRVTVSVGVAHLRPAHLNLQALIDDAEDAVAAARGAGGNCVRAAPVAGGRVQANGSWRGDERRAKPKSNGPI